MLYIKPQTSVFLKRVAVFFPKLINMSGQCYSFFGLRQQHVPDAPTHSLVACPAVNSVNSCSLHRKCLALALPLLIMAYLLMGDRPTFDPWNQGS